MRGDAEEDQGRAEHAQEDDAEERPGNRAASSRDRGPADDHGRDDLHLETDAGVRRNLVEADRVQHGGQAGQGPRGRERGARDGGGVDAGQSRGLAIGADCIQRAARRQVAQRPGGEDQQDRLSSRR